MKDSNLQEWQKAVISLMGIIGCSDYLVNHATGFDIDPNPTIEMISLHMKNATDILNKIHEAYQHS